MKHACACWPSQRYQLFNLCLRLAKTALQIGFRRAVSRLSPPLAASWPVSTLPFGSPRRAKHVLRKNAQGKQHHRRLMQPHRGSGSFTTAAFCEQGRAPRAVLGTMQAEPRQGFHVPAPGHFRFSEPRAQDLKARSACKMRFRADGPAGRLRLP